jgi:5-methylcytosine-specific restriction protein B
MQVDTQNLKSLYSGDFQAYLAEEWAVVWRANYVRDLTRTKEASRDEWLTPEFQQFLWDQNTVANIGPGRSVTVTSAYGDTKLAELFFDLKNDPRPISLADRGKRLQDAYETVLAAVWQKHNAWRNREDAIARHERRQWMSIPPSSRRSQAASRQLRHICSMWR